MTHSGPVIGQNGNLRVIQCLECGYAHLSPLPSQDELHKYYEKAFYQKDKKAWLKETLEDKDWLNASINLEIGMIGKSASGALLDVGAGYGLFIATAIDWGWNAAGLEPSGEACKFMAQNHWPHQQGFIEDTALNANTADIIRAAWVLEHLLDPGAVLDKFHQALKPTGKLLLTVPNDFTNLQAIAKRELKKKDDWWVHSSHVNYWNLRSLNQLLLKHGFLVAQFYTTYPMELYLLQGFDYIRDVKLGRRCHEQRKRLEMAMHASESGEADLARWQQSNAVLGIGRDLVVLGVKQ